MKKKALAFDAMERDSLNGGAQADRADAAMDALFAKSIDAAELEYWFIREVEFKSMQDTV
jgi:hypothetical protein